MTSLLAVVVLIAPMAGPASAAADVRAPELVEFDLAPRVVDVSESAQDVVVTMRITDDASGVVLPSIVFASVETTQSTGFGEVRRVSGTALDGVYEARVTIPQGAAPGTWEASLFPLRDEAGNSGSFGPPPGFPSTVTVSSAAAGDDIEPAPTPDQGAVEQEDDPAVSPDPDEGEVVTDPEPTPTPELVPDFSDVPESHTFHDDILWMAQSGVTSGFPDGTFGSAQGVTRGQMAAFMYRFAQMG